MKRTILIIGAMFFTISSFTQIQKGVTDVSLYPQISFVWNEYDPVVKNKTEFIISENGEKREFDFQNISSEVANRNKTILFLWEDMNHISHTGQFEFIRQFMTDFFKKGNFSDGDKFNIATFRRKGKNNLAIDTFLLNQFSSSTEQICQVVDGYLPQYDEFSKFSSSDVYRAIDEGIERLNKESAENIRILVVLSYGISSSKTIGGKNDTDDSRIEAVKSKIPVCLVEYNPSTISRFSSRIVIGTHGEHVSTTNPIEASQKLDTYLKNVSKKHYGQDYKLTFTTPQLRDDKAHSFVLTVNGVEHSLSYVAPSLSIAEWAYNNKWLAAIIALGIICILSIIGIIAVFNYNKHRIKRNSESQKVADLQKDLEETKEKNQKEFDAFQQNIEEEKRQTSENELRKIMNARNLFPQLNCEEKNNTFAFRIKDIYTTIGRDASNDIIFLNNTVSKKHAKIEFDGNDFVIIDCDSTNKVIVNGQFAIKQALKNGDTIGFGEAFIKFYV